jgi:hypothetical protein
VELTSRRRPQSLPQISGGPDSYTDTAVSKVRSASVVVDIGWVTWTSRESPIKGSGDAPSISGDPASELASVFLLE